MLSSLLELLIDGNFTTSPSFAIMYSSHKTIQTSMYQRLYKTNQWLKIGCMVPKISDEPDVRMCISGFVIDGEEKGITIHKNLTAKKLKELTKVDSPSIIFKSYTSPLYPDIGKMKAPTGLMTSRNTAVLHDPNAIDCLLCEGEIEPSGVSIHFNKTLFKDQSFESFLTPSLSILHPYLCNFNLPFWNSIFTEVLTPKMIEVQPTSQFNKLPFLNGLALVFPLSTATLYVYQPAHVYMIRKYLRSPFIVTPPVQPDSESTEVLGTVCRIEEIVSVGSDGALFLSCLSYM